MNYSINIKGTLIDITYPKIMGILNATPDSFSDGGRFNAVDSAITQAQKMVDDGASFIDIGGYSSRPGADFVSVDEEINRVVPIIEAIASRIDVPISIDTFRSDVVKEAEKAGAVIVNDISAGDDDAEMIKTVASLKMPFIAMHKKGNPKTMQNNPQYDSVLNEVKQYLLKKREECYNAGILDFIIDPGFGFGKSINHNYTLLMELAQFKLLEVPILVGISRKSMIYKALKSNPEKALNGTTFLHSYALQSGANILRVHDVKEARECIVLWRKFSGE